MKVSKEEILHIANLANIELSEEEIPKYLKNLQDILNYANIVNNAPVGNLEVTNGATNQSNVFRKDEIKIFEGITELMKNAPEKEDNMFKVPKVL